MSIRSTSLTLLFLSALAGCSAADAPASSSGAEQATAPTAETEASGSALALSRVATISVAGATIELMQEASDAASPILVSETFDLSRGSVLKRLTAEQPLTSLEIFVSLKPEAAVPDVLSAHHAAEARALGRADGSVLNVAFDANAAIEKWTSASCDSIVFQNEGTTQGKVVYSRKQRLDNVSGMNDLAVGTAPQTAVFTTSAVNLGVCNDATSQMALELWLIKAQGLPWARVWTGVTPANHATWWYMIALNELDTSCTPPADPEFICPPPPRKPAAYFVRGNGTKFRARTAEGRFVPRPLT
jgi:hypothetical protein